jgi:hypothetical protein
MEPSRMPLAFEGDLGLTSAHILNTRTQGRSRQHANICAYLRPKRGLGGVKVLEAPPDNEMAGIPVGFEIEPGRRPWACPGTQLEGGLAATSNTRIPVFTVGNTGQRHVLSTPETVFLVAKLLAVGRTNGW